MAKNRPQKKADRPVKLIRNQRVLVSFIQDMSGSMEVNWTETCDGFKTFIDSLKSKEGVDYMFSLALFNTAVHKPIIGTPIRDVSNGSLQLFRPTGGTSLFDAIGETIQVTKKFDLEADKILYVIVTDGQENASRIWTKDALHSVIDAELAAGKTTFQYLGCQPESWADGASIGLNAGQTVQYDARNIGSTYACIADATNNFAASRERSSLTMTKSYASINTLRAAGLKFDPKDSVDKLPDVT